jgi:hypothetical protein
MENAAKKRQEEIANEVIRDYSRLSGSRGTLDSHLQEVAETVWPNYSGSFHNNGFTNPGEKRTQKMVDSTAVVALNRFGAILDSYLTPRNQTWHKMKPSDPYLMKDRQTRLWFEEATRILFKYRYAPKANFSSQNQQDFKSLGAFGSSCLFTDKLASEPGLRYRNIHLSEIWFSENHQGVIDKTLRAFNFTARQAVKKWRADQLPETIVKALETNPDREFRFIHCVKPREDLDPTRRDYRGMPYVSYYVSVEGKQFLEEGGFQVFPYAISRYEQAPGETYGRGPAMEVLPTIKMLNEQKKTVLKQGHRAVDPIYLVHDDGVMDAFDAVPGGLVSGGVTADGRPLVHALTPGNIAIGKELMDDERQLIGDVFLTNLFQLLLESPQKTATEVMELTKEKGILIAPTMGRIQSEKLGPMIEREVDLLIQQRLMPPMPPALVEAQGEYSIEYDSPLSRAQRAEEAAGLMRTLEMALNVVNVTQNPAPLDHFKWDTIIPEVGDIHGLPLRWMTSEEELAQIRAGRAEQAETEQLTNAAPGAAAMIKATTAAQKGTGRK